MRDDVATDRERGVLGSTRGCGPRGPGSTPGAHTNHPLSRGRTMVVQPVVTRCSLQGVRFPPSGPYESERKRNWLGAKPASKAVCTARRCGVRDLSLPLTDTILPVPVDLRAAVFEADGSGSIPDRKTTRHLLDLVDPGNGLLSRTLGFPPSGIAKRVDSRRGDQSRRDMYLLVLVDPGLGLRSRLLRFDS